MNGAKKILGKEAGITQSTALSLADTTRSKFRIKTTAEDINTKNGSHPFISEIITPAKIAGLSE